MSDKSKNSLFKFSPNRRQVVKGTAAIAGAAAFGGFIPRSRAADGDTLTMLTWPGHVTPHVVGPFEERTGIKIIAKEYVGGEEMMSLLQQSPTGTYDVILTGNAYVEQALAGGFIEEMNPADYPIDDFWPEFQKFPTLWYDDKLYSVMIGYGFIGMAYNTDAFTPKEVSSYDVLWSEKAKGRLGHFDWFLPSMGVLSLYNGNPSPYDIDEATYQKVKETLFSLAPQDPNFYAFSGLFPALTGGDVHVVPGIGEWLTILMQKDGIPLAMSIPDEGGLQWTEALSIGKGTTKHDLVVKFIQYYSSPEGLVRESTKEAYASSIPSIPAWKKLNEERPADAVALRHQFDKPNVIDDIRNGIIHTRIQPVQQSGETWGEAWTEYKTL